MCLCRCVRAHTSFCLHSVLHLRSLDVWSVYASLFLCLCTINHVNGPLLTFIFGRGGLVWVMFPLDHLELEIFPL